ncbi:MAG: AbrB/MazE/SpoVT family DNA-binding domain-containing protein [Candidatus Omnitrophica bacterium]|nr:AbrB/MazE/SpoVT family DNA-binding domain-containing protein [Candidatus Omnitrophota bacterium]
MTITMTAKHQITIPQKVTTALGLEKGSMFEIAISNNRIELIPIETIEKVFTEEEYKKLDQFSVKQKGEAKRVTKKFIENLKKGRV